MSAFPVYLIQNKTRINTIKIIRIILTNERYRDANTFMINCLIYFPTDFSLRKVIGQISWHIQDSASFPRTSASSFISFDISEIIHSLAQFPVLMCSLRATGSLHKIIDKEIFLCVHHESRPSDLKSYRRNQLNAQRLDFNTVKRIYRILLSLIEE